MSALLLDAMGTLFDLAPLRERLGAPALEAWFERLLHSAASLTLVGSFSPFDELAESTLATTAARLGLEVDADEVLGALSQLPAVPDAAAAFDRAEAAGVRLAVLTNGGAENTRALLESAGLEARVERIFTTADVQAYKPAPQPYRHAARELGLDPREVTLVATHGWDVLGALGAGLQAVWVDREERLWPFPTPGPSRAPSLEEAVAHAIR